MSGPQSSYPRNAVWNTLKTDGKYIYVTVLQVYKVRIIDKSLIYVTALTH